MRVIFCALTILICCGCAPGYHYETGSFTPIPNDACMKPEMSSAGAISLLNARLGQTGGPPGRVVAIEGLRSVGDACPGPETTSLTCHGTLIMEGGRSETGVFSVTDPGSNYPIQVSWESDAIRTNRQAAADAAQHDRVVANSWTSFHGDLASWTGIPPLPPNTSSVPSPTAPLRCSVSDVVGHTVSMWTTKATCDEWIRKAKELAKSGPTIGQVSDYRHFQCVHGSPDSPGYSGWCAGMPSATPSYREGVGN